MAPPLRRFTAISAATNEAIHEIIRANLHRAPMYSGQIQSTGPRYCPSIEDKVVRFADKNAAPHFPRARRPRHRRDLLQRHQHVAARRCAGADRPARAGLGEREDPAARLRGRIRHGLADADSLDAGDQDDRGLVPRRPDQRHQRLRRSRGAGTRRRHQRGALCRQRRERISSFGATRPTSAC